MKLYFMSLALLLALTGFLVYQTSNTQAAAETTYIQQQVERERVMGEQDQNYIARVLIFTNGSKRILSEKKYLLRWEGAYLTPDAPTQISVADENATWEMFFKSIGVQVNQTCLVLSERQQFCSYGESSLKFYLNDVKDQEVLSKIIHDGDRLLVTYGAENQIELQKQLESLRELQ